VKDFPYSVEVPRRNWTLDIHRFFSSIDRSTWNVYIVDDRYFYNFIHEQDAIVFKLRFPCV